MLCNVLNYRVESRCAVISLLDNISGWCDWETWDKWMYQLSCLPWNDRKHTSDTFYLKESNGQTVSISKNILENRGVQVTIRIVCSDLCWNILGSISHLVQRGAMQVSLLVSESCHFPVRIFNSFK